MSRDEIFNEYKDVLTQADTKERKLDTICANWNILKQSDAEIAKKVKKLEEELSELQTKADLLLKQYNLMQLEMSEKRAEIIMAKTQLNEEKKSDANNNELGNPSKSELKRQEIINHIYAQNLTETETLELIQAVNNAYNVKSDEINPAPEFSMKK